MKEKLSGFVFYTQDYFGDNAVRLMPLELRAVWLEMLFLMHESPRPGVLLKPDRTPYSTVELATIIRCPVEIIENSIKYFIDAGVAAVDRNTRTLASRKMIRDRKRRENASKWGTK